MKPSKNVASVQHPASPKIEDFDVSLLEDAAHAVGLEFKWDSTFKGTARARVPGSGDAFPVWAPHLDDGDALRLAVARGYIQPGQWPDPSVLVGQGWDWATATRLAIVERAAQDWRLRVKAPARMMP